MLNYHNMTENELLTAAWMSDDPLADALRLHLEEIIEDDEKGQLIDEVEDLKKEVNNLNKDIETLEREKSELLAALIEAARSDNPDWDYINSVIKDNS